ncbi:hypothetical protein [Sulfuriroseicoccus oceanibius]|uniref:Uncharacterized protein n=1 Tax=Sulfuriroseicoccus oceanibius TaxID=2707525 RepID=A0A6B3L436_9BACT|nr:hypothetical protein [Sulfuriroseicoccus oceanibius]QQL45495.1 hypothetical protein G3M56_002585 [Sulfuriroseicoccus oceanibius]
MKNNPLILGALALSAIPLTANPLSTDDNYENIIIQIQTNEFGEEVRASLTNLAKQGTDVAPLPILYGDSLFELWSLNKTTGEQKLLDTTIVNGIYSPQITLVTPDPNDTPTKPRTRVDVGYSVQIDGISPAYHDAAANLLVMLYNLEPYEPESFQHPPAYTTDYASATDVSSTLATMMSNSVSYSSGFVVDDWTVVGGTETFSIWEPAADGGPAIVADTCSVQIWPVATIALDPDATIEPGKIYRNFKPIKINMNNLYAKDDWSVEIVDATSTTTEILSGTVIGDKPQFRQIQIANLADYLPGSGDYVLRVTQQAEGLDPVPVEHLSVSFSYDRRITVNGQVGTAE